MDKENLAALILREIEAAEIPGCSIAVVDRSGIVWTGAAGYANIRGRQKATPNTAYHLFSGTKLYTATAILQLVESGKLNLEDPAALHIPDLGVPDSITIKQLLSHTSGLKETLKGALSIHFKGEAPLTTGEALKRYKLGLKRAPGTKVEYCNANYALLGEVITRVAGQAYEDYVAEHILKPLNMSVAYTLTPGMKQDAATGYMRRWEMMRFLFGVMFPERSRKLYGDRHAGFVELVDYDLDTAAIGGLVGSVVEFAPFVIAQLNDGKGILNEESAKRMQTMAAEGQAGIESKVGVGLGWKFGQVDDRTFINHEGGGAGFTSETRIYPDHGMGMVIAMNRMNMSKTSIVAHRICEELFKAFVM